MLGGAVMELEISANIETCYFLSTLLSSLANNTLKSTIDLQIILETIYLLKFPVTHRQVHLSAQLGEN